MPASKCCGGGSCGTNNKAPTEEKEQSFSEKFAFAIKQVIDHKKDKKVAVDQSDNVVEEELDEESLKFAIEKALPPNYNFEILKTVKRLRKANVKHCGLQLPEGLLMFASTLADILQQFAPSVERTTIFGDTVFGACCIDDLTCHALGVDYLVHYGHSCLVPIDQTVVNVFYVCVYVGILDDHLVESILLAYPKPTDGTYAPKLALMCSIQFKNAIITARKRLIEAYDGDEDSIQIPQVRPLSAGETLGCTSGKIDADVEACIFVADGRFHLEAAMIRNPDCKFIRYDPYTKKMTFESYDHKQMHKDRNVSIEQAKEARCVGLVLGTLGRQGSVGVLEGVQDLLEARGIDHFVILLSEILPEKLDKFGKNVDAFVQVACPRLSIDWGPCFNKPVLTPYEAHVAWGGTEYKKIYPMDYYSNAGGAWANYGTGKSFGGSVNAKFFHLSQRRIQFTD